MPNASRRALRPAVAGLLLLGVAFGLLALLPGDGAGDGVGDEADEVGNVHELRDLPPNKWVKFHEERPAGWSRQAHAGMAFDTRRGRLLIFGSDTHGEDWDNAVHEFDPRRKRWETHQPAASPDSYRIDARGIPLAGSGAPMPWAMHTYDAIEYHPGLDALVVTSAPLHTPGPARAMRHPTWIYPLTTRQWRIFENGGAPSPTFFGGASAYDTRRGVLAAYARGLWEMDLDAGRWRRVSAEARHGTHHNMVYDPRRGEFFVFGAYKPTTEVWRYRPGAAIGAEGVWTVHRPGGDACPPYASTAVAYAAASDVFVLAVNDLDLSLPSRAAPRQASTWLYDPRADTYTRLRGAELPPSPMNTMMVWDPLHEVVFLVTGDRDGPLTVWAMKPRK